MSTDAMAAPVPDGGPVGLNSPPDSLPNIKDGGSDSELSDLEPEPDSKQIPLIIKPSRHEGGVPIFTPTMDDFCDFQRYINAVTPFGMKTGIVKVIPPPEWVADQPPLDEAIKTIQIKNPIMQDIAGNNGTYRQANMEKGRSYNLPQWRELCEKSEHQPPAKRGERRINQAPAPKPTPKTKASANKATVPKRKSARTTKGKAGATSEGKHGSETPDRLPTPVSPKDEDEESVKMEDLEPAPIRRMGGGGRMSKAISVSARRKNNQAQAALVDEAAFENFRYELDDKFPEERCAELERQYWKTLTFAPPLYGGDMPGTLFDDRTKAWNLSNLPNLLNVLGQKIPGVNTAYLYLGMWKATFAWHLEDVDLYSINYLHFGAPKQWYSISQGDARKFEKVMGGIWPIDSKKCDQFLRHKTYLISPSTLLSQHGIKANKIVHHPGEFIITFPYGYHSGYNLGYNCAEAVNFAVESWLEHARVAKRCECSDADDSVWVDYKEIERKLRGEDTDFEETDDDEDEDDDEEEIEVEISGLPSPPNGNTESKLKVPQKKRKRPVSDKGNKANVKKIRIRVKAPTKEPCILCPNDIPSEPLLDTDDGKKVHRICAQYIPETRIESGDKDIVMDLEHIPKARHDLKCNFCRSKKGACFQCSQKKCARAYHATCAAAAGVFVEQGEVPHFGEDGTEYKQSDFGFSCRFHRSKRDKKLDADALSEDARTLKAASELKVGMICQLQFYRGDIFAGAVVENRRSEETLLVDIVPRGERLEVEYKWLLLPDPSDYNLPKASANAIPMPKSFKDREMLNTTERLANDLPRPTDPFVTGTTWAEFKSENIARNMAQVKVDITNQANKIWYYLGKPSTEARAQFTENPAKPVHNPAGNFLDTLPKAAPIAPPRQSFPASYPSSHNQNALNPINRPAIRPPQPPTQSSTLGLSRSDKPYQYKPRPSGSEPYRIDHQAYLSQHSFVQRSAQTPAPILPPARPYGLNFNSDPKFQSGARASNSYPSSGPTQSHPSRTPAQGYVSKVPGQLQISKPSTQNHTAQPAIQNHASSTLNHNQANISNQANANSPLAPPASYRQPQPPTAQPRPANTSNSHNIVGSKSLAKMSPFFKYPYLQKEHNRSPLEYKSPYRPGGGFMNGYQGTKEQVEAAMRAKIFGPSMGRKPETPILPPARNYIMPNSQNRASASSPDSLPAQRSTQAPIATAKNSVVPAPKAAASRNDATTNAWAKKEGASLHPAIREEYKAFHHNSFQPVQHTPAPQYAKPGSQSSQMYHPKATYQSQAPYQMSQPQTTTVVPHTAPVGNGREPIYPTQSPTHAQATPANSHGPNSQNGQVLNTPQLYHSHKQPQPAGPSYQGGTNSQSSAPYQTRPVQQGVPQSQYSPQSYQPNTYQNGMAPQSMAQQQYIPTPPKTPAITQPVYNIQSQTPQDHYQQGQVIYPHQQNLQNWNENSQSRQVISRPDYQHELIDLPADSTSVLEKVLKNLRKVEDVQTSTVPVNRT